MSTAPAVIEALVVLGRATLGTDWQTIDGPVNSVTTTKARVFAVADQDMVIPQHPDSYGASGFAERYTVPLAVSISLPGTETLTVARAAALAACDAVCAAVLAAPGRNLGLESVIDAVPSEDRRLQHFASSDGRSVAVRFGVDVYAEI